MVSTPKFIGIKNNVNIFTNDPKFIQALKITFTYAITSVPIRLIFARLVAMLLAQKRKFVGLYRAIFYIPSVIGGSVVVAVMWTQLFGLNGAFNHILA